MKILSLTKKVYGVFRRYFIKIPQTMHTAKSILADGSKTYLVIGEHVGDLLITMGYCAAFKKAHQIEQLIICTTHKMQGIVSRYTTSKDQILCLNRETLEQIFYLTTSKYTAQWVIERGNIWLVDPIGYGTAMIGFDQYLASFPGITFQHFIKHGCLHLPLNARYQPLPLPDNTASISKNKKSIILSPACQNTWWNSKIPATFFLQLSRALSNYNVELYTNIGPADQDHKEIPGTKPLRLSFEELGNWISPDDIVIGIRSGLMDFLAYHNCHIICLYAPVNWFYSFYSLDMLPEKRCDYVEHIISGQDKSEIQKVIASVCKFLEMER